MVISIMGLWHIIVFFELDKRLIIVLVNENLATLKSIYYQGMYTCVAKNVVGKAYVAAYLQVASSSHLFLE